MYIYIYTYTHVYTCTRNWNFKRGIRLISVRRRVARYKTRFGTIAWEIKGTTAGNLQRYVDRGERKGDLNGVVCGWQPRAYLPNERSSRTNVLLRAPESRLFQQKVLITRDTKTVDDKWTRCTPRVPAWTRYTGTRQRRMKLIFST